VEGYLARGTTTNLTGLWKAGKTTWLAHLLKSLGGSGTFCGLPVVTTKVLVVSEETDRLWIIRRDALRLGDHVEVITRPFLGRPDPRAWGQLITHVGNHARAAGCGLVVFDSLFNLWSVRDENDAAVVIEALMPLNRITEAGTAVLVITHPAKAESGEGRASRGSGALAGFVDVIVEMRRYDPERRDDTRRLLTAYSRFEETPAEIVLEFRRESGYEVVGSKVDARAADRLAIAMDLLPRTPPGATPKQLMERWPVEGPPRPGKRTLEGDLAAAVARGIHRTGTGKRNDPFRYLLADDPNGPNTFLASLPPYTPSLRETNTDPLEISPKGDGGTDNLTTDDGLAFARRWNARVLNRPEETGA
jgi:hypothetical protein